MNITLPDEFFQTAQITEAELLEEIAIMLYQRQRIRLDQAAQLAEISVDDFYQLLISRNSLTPSADPDDDPDELVLASLRASLQQIKAGKVHPVSELWDDLEAAR
jgi:predicted HTH domain antitoxin